MATTQLQSIGIVGFGKMGTIYAKMAKSLGIKDVFVYDINNQKTLGDDLTITPMESLEELAYNTKFVVVSTNTSSHVQVIESLSAAGVTHIFCEKPLGMHTNEVARLNSLSNSTQIFTAFLINFSPAVEQLLKIITTEDLILREGYALWGKNRTNDPRPTIGNLEDETVHAAQLLTLLGSTNATITKTTLATQLTRMSYANRDVQNAANLLDEAFPKTGEVTSSAHILETLHLITKEQQKPVTVPISIYSSFLLASQKRVVGGVLGKHPDSVGIDVPQYSFAIEFDLVQDDGTIQDKLTLTKLSNNELTEQTFTNNKVMLELSAFVKFVNTGEVDHRLTNLIEAQTAVAFTDTAIKSSK